MYPKYFKTILVLIILGVLESCGILFPRKNEPFAKACFFDPELRSVIYKKKDNKGIKRIEIELISAEKSTTYFKKNYTEPIQCINLSLMDTVVLMQNFIQIRIWDSSPVIEDYNLVIKPSDWKQDKLVYCRHSKR